MFALPEKMFVSKTKHNCDLQIFCDWIEINALFLGQEVSGSDLVDILIENHIYSDQDFAWEFVNNAFSTLDVRRQLLGHGYPLVPFEDGYEGVGEWEDFAPYAFCLMLSLARSHPGWIRGNFTADYTEQGELFEDLTAEALRRVLPGWQVRSTGWSKARVSHLKTIVEEICTLLNEAAGDVYRWTRVSEGGRSRSHFVQAIRRQ